MLAEDFGYTINQPWTLDCAIIDHISANVVPIRANRTRKQDLWHIEQPGRFEYVERSHCVGVDRARRVGFGGNGEHRAQVIDYRRPDLFHHVQDMAEVPQVSPHQLNLVEYIAQPLCISADMENNRSLFASCKQKTRNLSADKASSAG